MCLSGSLGRGGTRGFGKDRRGGPSKGLFSMFASHIRAIRGLRYAAKILTGKAGFSLHGPAGMKLHYNADGSFRSMSLKSCAGMRVVLNANGKFKGLSIPGPLKGTRIFTNSRGEFTGFGLPRLFGGFMLTCLMNSGENGQIGLLRNLITQYLLINPEVARIFFNTIIGCAHDEWNHTVYNQKIMKICRRKTYSISAVYGMPKPDDIVKAYGKEVYVSKKENIIDNYLYKEKSMELSSIKIEELDPGLLFIAMNVGLKLSDSEFLNFAKRVMPVFIKELSKDNRESIMNTYYQRLDFKKLFERELGEDNGSYEEAINLLFDNADYQMFSNDTIKAYISIFEHVGALYFDSYKNDGKRMQLRKCLEYAESYIDRIQVPFVKNGLERILIFDFERFGSNWNRCTTSYSYNDKLFLCRLWGKYYKGHEQDVVMSMYQMRIDELLPEILPVLSDVVESLAMAGEIVDKTCALILKSIVLKVLLNFPNAVKADQEFHEAYEKILNSLIQCNDESAAVILDEYRTH